MRWTMVNKMDYELNEMRWTMNNEVWTEGNEMKHEEWSQ